MSLKSSKIFILIIVAIFITASVFWFTGHFSKSDKNFETNNPLTPAPPLNSDQSNESPRIVSTKPEPLENNIVSGKDTVEITFNRPLENVGEFKVRIEPKIDYKVELSGDSKTAKIIPAKPYPLGTTFTLFIGPESKFDGVGRWGEEKVFHFRTIKYTGV